MVRSALASVRSGEWRRIEITALVVVAAVSVALDVITTYGVLLHPDYQERNVALSALAEVDPLLATAYQLASAGSLVVVAALTLGWASRTAAVYAIVTNGLLGVNNTVLFLREQALLTTVGIDVGLATNLIVPIVGLALGLAWEYAEFGLPVREVVAVVTLVGAVTVGSHLVV